MDSKILSNTVKEFGYSNLSDAIRKKGYGGKHVCGVCSRAEKNGAGLFSSISKAARIADKLTGYGKKGGAKTGGANLFGKIKALAKRASLFLKDTKVLSSLAKDFNEPDLAQFLIKRGYGREEANFLKSISKMRG